MAHRGGGAIYPEHCIWTYNKQIANFQEHGPDVSMVLEADLHVLLHSGDLLVHHDDTLDRTTTGTGTTGGTGGVRTLGDYKALTVDHYGANGAVFLPASDLKMVTGREFIDVYGRQVCMNFECKYTQAREPLATLIHEYGAEDFCTVYVATVADRDFFLARGIRVQTAGDATEYGIKTPEELYDLGVRDVGFGYIAIGDEAAWAIAEDYTNAGLNIWAGGTRRAEWRNYREHPDFHYGGYSDEPLWTSGFSPRYETDKFADKVFLPGHIAYGYGFPGRFLDLAGGVTGWGPNASQNGWVLWGWCSPHPSGGHGSWDVTTGEQEEKEPTYPFGIEFDATRISGTSPNHWISIAFADDDMPVHDSRSAGSNTTGRHVLFVFVNLNGVVVLIDKVDATDTVLGSTTFTAIGVGGKHRYRFEYLSPTEFKVTNVTTSESATATIPEGLGTNGYINAGTPNSGSGGEWAFSNVQLF